MHRSGTVYKRKQTNMLVDFDVREQQMDLSTGGSFIMDYGLWTGLWIFSPECKHHKVGKYSKMFK